MKDGTRNSDEPLEPNALVSDWLESGWLLGIGAAGVILIVLGLKRDDAMGWIFLTSGLVLMAYAFGSQFLGWKF